MLFTARRLIYRLSLIAFVDAEALGEVYRSTARTFGTT